MATPPHPLKRLPVWIGGALLALPLAIGLFLSAAWIGSSVPRNSDRLPVSDGITIMVETNGIHTGIVMPVVTEVEDWRHTFPSAAMPRDDGQLPTHVAIGWGEKEVFLHTPTWSDLKVATAVRILFRGGDGLMRVGHYVRPAPSPYHRPITLRPAEYRRLVEKVKAALPPLPDDSPRHSYDSYEVGARNYDAAGRYTIANTCNQWVGDTLAYAGLEIGAWTPLAGGVMKWIPEPR